LLKLPPVTRKSLNSHITAEGRLGTEELLGRLRPQAEGLLMFVKVFVP
jgi:hypothetical protein